MSSPEVIYIEGLPASGKTTLIGRMALRYPDALHAVSEYVDPQAARHALESGDETFFMRNDELKYETARQSSGPCLVDRGHLSTVLYNKAYEMLHGFALVDVDTWYRRQILGNMMLPDAYVHLDSEPMTSLKRRPPAVGWTNVWDDERALAFARQGYADYMSGPESSVPVLRITADRMNFAQIDDAVGQFLMTEAMVSL